MQIFAANGKFGLVLNHVVLSLAIPRSQTWGRLTVGRDIGRYSNRGRTSPYPMFGSDKYDTGRSWGQLVLVFGFPYSQFSLWSESSLSALAWVIVCASKRHIWLVQYTEGIDCLPLDSVIDNETNVS